MKQGLLFKDAPEPLTDFICRHEGCNTTFYYLNEYKKHRLEKHGQRYEYFLQPAYDKEYLGEVYHYKAELTKKWLKSNESQGLMAAPLYIPKRPVKRFFASIQQLNNMNNGLCHCGNSFKWPRRKHCSDECAGIYQCEMFTYWSIIRIRFINKHAIKNEIKDGEMTYGKSWKCEHCSIRMVSDYQIEIDHIIAIMFGGHPWDFRNFQLLCHTCHAKKTRSDRQIQKFWRDTQYYDPVFARNTSQQMIESFTQA